MISIIYVHVFLFQIFFQVVIFFLHNILMKYAIGFSCVALLAEVNGIFLHARKLMQIFQFGFNHKLYVINKYMNLMTFVTCRMFPIGRIFYGVSYECQALTPPVVRTFLCLLTIMAVINMVLLWRICKSDVLSTSRRKIGWKNRMIYILWHDYEMERVDVDAIVNLIYLLPWLQKIQCNVNIYYIYLEYYHLR